MFPHLNPFCSFNLTGISHLTVCQALFYPSNANNFTKLNYQSQVFDFYKDLIKLRKTHPVLKETNKDNLKISEDRKFFTIERWKNENRVVVFLNFEEEARTGKIPEHINGSMTKIQDSTDFSPTEISETKKTEVSANDKITVQKKSIVIFSK